MRATVRDVAARAGVSPKTVSNVINGVVFVRPETRERVESAVTELQYVPNLSARGLRNGRTGAIALALPDLTMEYTAEMVHWFVEVAHERGWTIQLEETGLRPERERELLSRGREHLVDGLVLNPVTLEASAIVGADALPPVVVIGEVPQTLVDQVSLDSVAAARDMTEYLISLGHRRIAVVGAPAKGFDTATSRARFAGYCQALADAGIPADPSLALAPTNWIPQDAGDVFRERFAGRPLPDAVFCFTDALATGVMRELWATGASAPDDISIAGFDDVPAGRFATPPLTTISFDKRTFVETTLSLLEDRIGDRTLPPRQIQMPHTIVPRASTRAR